jgi:DNA-binding NarL/FixJ family response regulator
MYSDSKIYKEALKTGVHGYILKNSSKQDLLTGFQPLLGLFHKPRQRSVIFLFR